MDLEIRSAKHDDAEGIWAILSDVIVTGDTFAHLPDAGRDETLNGWTAPGTSTFVAIGGGEIVGTYLIRPNQPGLGAHVANASFAVSPSARGEGIGRAMGEHALAEAARRGYRAMQFNLVVAENEGAVRLWESLGFDVVARLPGAFHQRRERYVDALVMYRELT